MKKINLWSLVLLGLLAAPAMASTLRLAVISDLNGSYGSTHYNSLLPAAIDAVVNLKPDLVISTGDMVAGQRLPLLPANQVQAMWRAFDEKVTHPLQQAGLLLAVTPGNHDGSAAAKFSRERELYRKHWQKNKAELSYIDDSHYPFYYAFEKNGVLFASLDITLVKHVDDQQKKWLEQLLADKGKDFSHRVVFSHLPIWASAQGRERDISADRELEELLKRHAVDLYLSGHHHTFYPGYHNGIGHIHQGCLGSGKRKLLGTSSRSPRSFTLIDFAEDGKIDIAAYGGKDYQQPVNIGQLPEKLVSNEVTLIRYDLAVD